MNKIILTQYIQGGITILIGIVGLFLPHKYNIFKFKNRGIGALLAEKIPMKIQERIPKVIGGLCVFAGIVVILLTAILGDLKSL